MEHHRVEGVFILVCPQRWRLRNLLRETWFLPDFAIWRSRHQDPRGPGCRSGPLAACREARPVDVMSQFEEKATPLTASGDAVLSNERIRYLLGAAENAVRKVQDIVRDNPETRADFEGNDVHTSLDRDIHWTYLRLLRQTGIKILSEEDYQSSAGFRLDSMGLQWVVDPVDGSYNHWRAIPFYCTSIALLKDGEPLIGVIGNLVTGDVYTGTTVTPAMKNGHKISVSVTRDLSRAVIATGLPVGTALSDWAVSFSQKGFRHFGKIRMFGSAAMSLALVAEGSIDAYWESGIFVWDVAAGVAICSAAGVVIKTTQLGQFRLTVEARAPSLCV